MSEHKKLGLPWEVTGKAYIESKGCSPVPMAIVLNQSLRDEIAEFIVRSGNAHHDLVAALEELTRNLSGLSVKHSYELLNMAKAAIAKAKPEEDTKDAR